MKRNTDCHLPIDFEIQYLVLAWTNLRGSRNARIIDRLFGPSDPCDLSGAKHTIVRNNNWKSIFCWP